MALATFKRRAQQLANIFENGETEFNYGFARRLGDGRGFAFGCLRWRTGLGDGLGIVRRYAAAKPGVATGKYLPALEAIKRGRDPDSLVGLEGFEAAVAHAASRDPVFRMVQREEVDELYWSPSQSRARSLGFRYDLSKSLIYDTWVHHGPEDKPGRAALVMETIIEMTNSCKRLQPGKGGRAERDWVLAFLDSRQYAMATAEGVWRSWRASTPRINVYRQLITAGAWNFDRPIVLGSSQSLSNMWVVSESSFGRHTIT
ncbi:hypothetical protein CBR_g45560 [Chara braunii]|uniref:Uncharacterized protein n=1 Tax=Chara braunii TaxID=69332 RepID=A0A388LZ09_CHABU|nr:hypothetical protein CBR_g45560 [Chara braunii]|eukprot:GBG87501.1 hypothetical protein CBR_g45560 [Chara braunii]